MARVMVTGATGFIGRAVVAALLERGHEVLCAVRSGCGALPEAVEVVCIGQIGPDTDWHPALAGVDIVVHSAGLAHLPDKVSVTTEAAFVRVNAEGTRSLAEAAAKSGVRRILLLSSIGVNGRASLNGPFREEDAPDPEGNYARSKLAAEESLKAACESGGVEWCILRPPMVYGARAPGNFARLVKLVSKGWPLPLGCATAKRSFISLENLVSAILTAIERPEAANSLFLVSDGKDVSSADFVRAVGTALGTPVLLLPVPEMFLRMVGAILGKGSDVGRLFDPLQIDCSRVRTRLSWRPPLAFEEGMRRAVSSGRM